MMRLQSAEALLQVDILRRSYPNSLDYWDGNWLRSEITIKTSGLNCFYSTNLRADDFLKFSEGIKNLITSLIGEVEFQTMEEGLYLKGQLEATGNIKWDVLAKTEPGGISLSFIMLTDNASIDELLKDIQNTLSNYPVIGGIS
ncbi:hypothetical protein DYBT9623_00028 [Dyadobacter sp. CECT 9623]|uniref:Uncharacterized protein n=1 Tax=Dyadobacter linearis TaxID=2823330 RepID=A0ABM8UIU0_9BACT|nr:hypothetical protein [Dyadobacter sp. CECT 9623]CAG5067308.1 hypothetical protein DYBT9623_00028 [Dyadobacter sp. CECT 9623]